MKCFGVYQESIESFIPVKNFQKKLNKWRKKMTDYNETPWAQLYGSLISGIGVDPKNFQMIYPFTAWDWPTEDRGYIGDSQFDFCSVLPQWSAVGAYVSSGEVFHKNYLTYLNLIVANTENPELRKKIEEATDNLTNAKNEYDDCVNKANIAYKDEVGDSNTPPFTEWLGTYSGKGWKTKIIAAEKNLEAKMRVKDDLVKQTQTPNLQEALDNYSNKSFYSKLNDPNLPDYPDVPSYSVSQNSRDWIDKAKLGEVPTGNISWSASDEVYDLTKTWASGSARIGRFFWGISCAASWFELEEFYSDKELQISMEFKGWETIFINPADWYNSGIIKQGPSLPFYSGYSAYKENGGVYMFGEGGIVSLLKTGMIVVFNPTFSIEMSQSSYDRYESQFKAATGFRIGPFTFGGTTEQSKSSWTSSTTKKKFSGQCISDVPFIIGVTLNLLP